MTERTMIHIGGSPGSGKSRMAKALVERLHETTLLRAEHISIGDRVRTLARSAINSSLQQYIAYHIANPHTTNQPLDEKIISEILDTSLHSTTQRDIDVVLLDGYPRYLHQTSLYFNHAETHGYKAPGALITQADIDTALARILKRSSDHQERATTSLTAWNKLIEHNETYPAVIRQLGASSLWFEVHRIDTSGTKQHTDSEAFRCAMQLLNHPLPKSA